MLNKTTAHAHRLHYILKVHDSKDAQSNPQDIGAKAHRLMQLHSYVHLHGKLHEYFNWCVVPGVVVTLPTQCTDAKMHRYEDEDFDDDDMLQSIVHDLADMKSSAGVHNFGDSFAVRSSSPFEDGLYASHAGQYLTELNVSEDNLLASIARVRDSADGHMIPVLVMPMIQGCSGVAFSHHPITGDECVVVEMSMQSAAVTDGRGHDTFLLFRHPESDTVKIEGTPPPHTTLSSYNLLMHQIHNILQHSVNSSGESNKIEIEFAWDPHTHKVFVLQVRPITAICNESSLSKTSSHGHPPLSINNSLGDTPWMHIWDTQEPHWMMDAAFLVRAGASPRHQPMFIPDQQVYVRQGETYSYYVNGPGNIHHTIKQSALYDLQLFDQIESVYEKTVATFSQYALPGRISCSRDALCALSELSDIYKMCISFYTFSSSLVTNELESMLLSYVNGDRCKMIKLIGGTCELDVMQQEQLSWHQLVKDCADTFDKAKFMQHVWKYPYLALNFMDESTVCNWGQQRFKYTVSDSGFSAGVYYQTLIRIRQESQQCRQSVSSELPADMRHSFEEHLRIMDNVSASRMKMKYGWAGCSFMMLPTLQYISTNKNVPIKELWNFYNLEALQSLLLEPPAEPAAASAPSSSQRLMAWHNSRGEITRYTSGDVGTILQSLQLGRHAKKVDALLCGKVVSLPDVKPWTRTSGVVRVLETNNANETTNMEPLQCNEIVVTSMLQPNVLDHIKGCCAVVCEEGGLLSHAAIVCREMEKLCIVGCKGAITQLNTGDRICITDDGCIQKE